MMKRSQPINPEQKLVNSVAKSSLSSNNCDFEAVVLASVNFSKIQMHLSTIKKGSPYPLLDVSYWQKGDEWSGKIRAPQWTLSIRIHPLDLAALIYPTGGQVDFYLLYHQWGWSLLKTTPTNKADKPDGIGNLSLRNCANVLGKSLAFLFDIAKKQKPQALKNGLVVPGHNDGGKHLVKNYLPWQSPTHRWHTSWKFRSAKRSWGLLSCII